jgi:hypothetical protein
MVTCLQTKDCESEASAALGVAGVDTARERRRQTERRREFPHISRAYALVCGWCCALTRAQDRNWSKRSSITCAQTNSNHSNSVVRVSQHVRVCACVLWREIPPPSSFSHPEPDETYPADLDDSEQWRSMQLSMLHVMIDTLKARVIRVGACVNISSVGVRSARIWQAQDHSRQRCCARRQHRVDARVGQHHSHRRGAQSHARARRSCTRSVVRALHEHACDRVHTHVQG